jgi:hypothetical protein
VTVQGVLEHWSVGLRLGGEKIRNPVGYYAFSFPLLHPWSFAVKTDFLSGKGRGGKRWEHIGGPAHLNAEWVEQEAAPAAWAVDVIRGDYMERIKNLVQIRGAGVASILLALVLFGGINVFAAPIPK